MKSERFGLGHRIKATEFKALGVSSINGDSVRSRHYTIRFWQLVLLKSGTMRLSFDPQFRV